MNFNIGDILTNRWKKQEDNNVIFYYVIVGFDDTYTYTKRLDSPDNHKPARHPTQNMSWFFNVVSRAE